MFKTVLRHSSYLYGSKLLTRLLFTAFVAFAASRLGPELFGILIFAMAMVELLSQIGDLGLTRYGARELIRKWDDRATLNGQILVFQMATSVLFCIIGLLIVFVWQPPSPKFQLLLMGLVAVLLSGVVNASESAFIARQKFFYSAIVAFVARVIFVGAAFMALAAGYSVTAIMAGFLASVIIESFMRIVLVVSKVSGFSFNFRLSDLTEMVLGLLPFTVAAVAAVVFSQISIVALEILKGDADVGVFGVANSFYIPFIWVSIVMQKVTFPGVTQVVEDNKDRARMYCWQWYRLLAIAGVPIAVTASLVAGPALSFFPEGYKESSAVLIILMWAIPVALVSAFEMNIMQVTGDENAAARILVISTLATVLLEFILIPLLGVKGAAFAVLSGAIIREIQIYYVVKTNFMMKHYIVLFLRPILGGLAMVAAALIAWNLGPWIATFLGLTAYVLTIFLSGAVRPSELKTLARS